MFNVILFTFIQTWLSFRQIPFLNSDDGIYEVEFIENRRKGLEVEKEGFYAPYILPRCFWKIICMNQYNILTYVYIEISSIGNVITYKNNEIISTNCDVFFVFISFLDEHFLLV